MKVSVSHTGWDEVRAKRTHLLAACDWTELPSASARLTADDRAAWEAYRQALRDITGTFKNAQDVCWPLPPV